MVDDKKRRPIFAPARPPIEVLPPVFDNVAAAKILERVARREARKALPPEPLPEPTFDLSHRRPKKGERVVILVDKREK